MKNTNRLERPALALIALLAWLGVGVFYYIVWHNPESSEINAFQLTLGFLNYFTILTNLLVAISSTISLLAPQSALGRFFSSPNVRSPIALYIVIVGIVFNVMLRALITRVGFADQMANELRHLVVPVLYVLFWLFIVPKGVLNWRQPIYWLIYPLVYLVWVAVYGGFTGRYPYSFMDVGNIGYTKVLTNSLMLIVLFFIVGEIFVGVDRLLGRKRNNQIS
ncbi:MAG: Pr6Pr family membrane protein [Pyrinomonadaceae bacterium]